MKKLIFAVGLILATVSTQAQDCFGNCDVVKNANPMPAERFAEAVKAVRTLGEAGIQRELSDVTIKAEVVGVCQVKGCWATVKLPDGDLMTIKFKDYAFFLPKDCAGKTVTCHGKMFVKTTTVAELRHLAEDAGKSKREIRKIKKDKKEVRFEADGVLLS